jgi:CO dehydrogenase/acetyl-CoA synthase delta subunit
MKLEEVEKLKLENLELKIGNLILQSPHYHTIIKLKQQQIKMVEDICKANNLDISKIKIDFAKGEIEEVKEE